MTIKEILINKKEIIATINGWVVSNRGNAKIKFITINDGSTFNNIQVVIKKQTTEVDHIRIGAAVRVEGQIKLTPNSKQTLELVCSSFEVLSNTDEDFPLQKQIMSQEFLREIPHLRHRTNIFRAIMRIRSSLCQEIHAFFNKEGFLNMASPIITSNDGEGAGEAFVVDDESDEKFFGKKATLGVTGQLHAEAYALGFGKVYTFAPTFRAEKSRTTKHIAEFWMIEPEVAFLDMKGGIELAINLIKTIIKNVLDQHHAEFNFLNEHVESNLLSKLNNLVENPIPTINYSYVIKKLQEVKNKFKNQNITFGIDLDTEHEKYIAEELYKSPIAVVNYPKNIKAFYMHQNDDKKTVAAFDILFPGIGEMVGGSQRETDVNKLLNRMKEMGMKSEEFQWYLDLRRFGIATSTGFGIGFERLIMYVTGIKNIRDTIPFPRTPDNLKM